MPRIRIDKINIQAKGISPQKVRNAANNLGASIQTRLHELSPMDIHPGTRNIGEVDLGSVNIDRGATSAEISDRIASRILNSVGNSVDRKNDGADR